MEENVADLLDEVESLVFGPDPAEALEPFDRFVAAYDASPDPELQDDLLKLFGYVVLQFSEYPGLPLARSRQLLDDLERRHREAGNSLRIVHSYRWTIARHIGDQEAAEAAFQAWSAAPRDEFTLCEGCEQTDMVKHLVETDRPDQAIELAAHAFAHPTASCREQQSALRVAVMPAYLKVGDSEAAAEAHRVAYRMVRDDPDELFAHAQHIRFCLLTGNQERAEELLQRHLEGLEADISRYDELWFSVAVGQTQGGEFADRALRLAAEFDERNGTTHQSELVTRSLNEQPWIKLTLIGDDGCSQQLEAAKARPDDPRAAWDLAKARIEMAHRMHLAERDLEAAEIGEQVLAALEDPRIADLAEPKSLHVLRNVLFAAYFAIDEPKSALTQADLVLENAPADVGPDWHGMVLRKKGELLERLNRDDDAMFTLVAAAAQYGLAGQLHEQVAALRLAAQSARYLDDLPEAEALLAEARAVVDKLPVDDQRTPTSDAVVHWELALVRDLQGRLPEAIELATTAAELYESVGQLESASNARGYVANRQATLSE